MWDVLFLCFVQYYFCFSTLSLSYCMRSANYLVSGLTYNQVIHGICSHGLQAKNWSNLLQNLPPESVHKPKPPAWSAAIPVENTKLLPHEKSTIRSAKLKMQNGLGKRGKNQDTPKYYICYPEQTTGQTISPLSKNPGDCEIYSNTLLNL